MLGFERQPHSGHKICVIVLKDPSAPLPDNVPAVERRALDTFVSRLAEKKTVLDSKRVLSQDEWRRAKEAWKKLVPSLQLSRTTAAAEPSASDEPSEEIAIDEPSDQGTNATAATDALEEAERSSDTQKKRTARASSSPRRSRRIARKSTLKSSPTKRAKVAAKPATKAVQRRRKQEPEEEESSAEAPASSPPPSPPPPTPRAALPSSQPPPSSPMPPSPPPAPQQTPIPSTLLASAAAPPVTAGYAPHLMPGVIASAYDMTGLNPRSGHGLGCLCCVCFGVHQRGCCCGMTFRR